MGEARRRGRHFYPEVRKGFLEETMLKLSPDTRGTVLKED